MLQTQITWFCPDAHRNCPSLVKSIATTFCVRPGRSRKRALVPHSHTMTLAS